MCPRRRWFSGHDEQCRYWADARPQKTDPEVERALRVAIVARADARGLANVVHTNREPGLMPRPPCQRT